MSPRELLMIPGPVEYEPEVLQALGGQSASHMGPRFVATFGRALKGLREIFGSARGQPMVVAGSGTLAMELAVANLVEPGDAALVVNTGYFSERMGAVLERHGARVVHVRAAPGEAPSAEDVATALAAERFKLVAITHVDTSTGVLAPVEPIARRAAELGVLTVVDGVCSVGGEALPLDAWAVDVAVTASQKALGVPPGLALACVGERALAAHRARRAPVASYFCDWANWLPIFQGYERGEPAYFATPPVNLVDALERSVAQILEEGLERRVERHRRMAMAMRAGWRALRLEALPRSDAVAAHTLSALYFPAGIDASLVARVRDEGVVIAGGLLPALKGRYFRVGHMGAVRPGDVLTTVGAVGRALARMGARVDPAEGVAAAQRALAD